MYALTDRVKLEIVSVPRTVDSERLVKVREAKFWLLRPGKCRVDWRREHPVDRFDSISTHGFSKLLAVGVAERLVHIKPRVA